MRKPIALLLFYLIMITISCNFDLEKVDSPCYYHSQTTLAKSKELGVFLTEYEPLNVDINDSINFKIYEAWIENVYNYSDLEKDGTLKEKYKAKSNHLSFCIKDNFIKKYPGLGITWNIEGILNVPPSSTSKNQFTYFSSYKQSFQEPFPDSIEIRLTYSVPSKDSNKFDETLDLGKFYLHKKKLK